MKVTEHQLRTIIREALLLEQPATATTDVGAIESRTDEEDFEVEDPSEITTVGHLAQLIAQARSKKKGETIKSKIKDTVVDTMVAQVPGLSTARSIFDFTKERYGEPDDTRTQTTLDHVATGVDDKVSAMLDDDVEERFVDDLEGEMENANPDTPLADFNINAALQNWLADEFESRTVSGFGKHKLILNKKDIRRIILESL